MSRAKKFKFVNLPIIIGDRAMEYHKLQPTSNEQAELMHLLVSAEDFEILLDLHKNEKVVPWGTYVADDSGIFYFANWYGYKYNNIMPVKIKNKLVVDQSTLLIMLALVALDKKNKIPKATAKKYLAEAAIVANALID